MNARLARRRLLAASLLVVVVGACKEKIDPRRVTQRDEGSICLGVSAEVDGGEGGVPNGVDLRANQPLAISVRTPCLSNYCATDRTSKCAVKREGDRLVVTSQLSWIGPEDLGTPCPRDCTFLEAKCSTTEALPEGHYKVVLGAHAVDVALPSHVDVRCDGDKPPGRYVPPAPIVDAAPPQATPAANVDPSNVPAAPGTGVVAEPPPGDTICIGPGSANKNRALKTGQPIAVTVLHKNHCVSSSCTKAPGKCTAKRKGTTIVVSTQFPSSTTKPTSPCTEDCSATAATCRTDALPAGSYTLEIGTQRKTVQVPAASAPGCSP